MATGEWGLDLATMGNPISRPDAIDGGRDDPAERAGHDLRALREGRGQGDRRGRSHRPRQHRPRRGRVEIETAAAPAALAAAVRAAGYPAEVAA
jgi:hypothetical protein